MRQHRLDGAGRVDARRRAARLRCRAASPRGTWAADVGDVHPHADAPAVERLGRDRVVEVARADRVDRERRELAQVAARAVRPPALARARASSASRSAVARSRGAGPRSSSSASITSRATSGRPIRRSTRAEEPRRGRRRRATRSPSPRAARASPAPGRRRSPRASRPATRVRSAGGGSNSGSAVRKRPRRCSTATSGVAPASRELTRALAASVSSATFRPWSFVDALGTFTSG